MTIPKRRALISVAALLMCGAFGVTLAQTYPSKPVRMIAPFPTGGGTDIVSRIIAQRMSEKFGQQVVVENRPGAAGSVGLEAVTRAPPDGYTLCFASTGAVTPARV